MKLRMKGELYAIRDTVTGLFMPEPKGLKATQIETRHWSASRPRLFHSRKTANLAAAAWAKGPWRIKRKVGSLGDSFYYTSPPASPPPDRVAANLELVVFEFHEI